MLGIAQLTTWSKKSNNSERRYKTCHVMSAQSSRCHMNDRRPKATARQKISLGSRLCIIVFVIQYIREKRKSLCSVQLHLTSDLFLFMFHTYLIKVVWDLYAVCMMSYICNIIDHDIYVKYLSSGFFLLVFAFSNLPVNTSSVRVLPLTCISNLLMLT